ncbi:MAG: hypothetical protein WDW36_006484 [Sanguina aurantia]
MQLKQQLCPPSSTETPASFAVPAVPLTPLPACTAPCVTTHMVPATHAMAPAALSAAAAAAAVSTPPSLPRPPLQSQPRTAPASQTLQACSDRVMDNGREVPQPLSRHGTVPGSHHKPSASAEEWEDIVMGCAEKTQTPPPPQFPTPGSVHHVPVGFQQPSASKPAASIDSKVDLVPAGPGPVLPTPPCLTDILTKWEIEDIPHLVSTLRGWLHTSPFPDELPFNMRDPALVLEQLEEAIAALPNYFAATHTVDAMPAAPRTTTAAAATATDVPGQAAALGRDGVSSVPSSRLPDVGVLLSGQWRLPVPAGVLAKPGRSGWLRLCTEEEVPEAWRACMARSPKVSNMAALPSDTVEETGETDPLTDTAPLNTGQRSAQRVPGVMHVSGVANNRLAEAGRAGKHQSQASLQMRRKLGL